MTSILEKSSLDQEILSEISHTFFLLRLLKPFFFSFLKLKKKKVGGGGGGGNLYVNHIIIYIYAQAHFGNMFKSESFIELKSLMFWAFMSQVLPFLGVE